jgi:protein dithiol oxidoreductase (disulfide-forming)
MTWTAWPQRLIAAFFLIVTLQAAQAMPIAERDYAVLEPPVAGDSKDKIEVVEVFSYACPHCYEFEPAISSWIKNLPADATMRRVPVGFGRDSWATLAKAYYALDAIGQQQKLHGKIFDAMHAQNINLGDPETLIDWVAKQGVDRKQFADALNSFGVAAKAQRGDALAKAYGAASVPTLIVDGKYRVGGPGVRSHADMLRVAGELIQVARAQRPAKAAAAEPLAKPAAVPAKK